MPEFFLHPDAPPPEPTQAPARAIRVAQSKRKWRIIPPRANTNPARIVIDFFGCLGLFLTVILTQTIIESVCWRGLPISWSTVRTIFMLQLVPAALALADRYAQYVGGWRRVARWVWPTCTCPEARRFDGGEGDLWREYFAHSTCWMHPLRTVMLGCVVILAAGMASAGDSLSYVLVTVAAMCSAFMIISVLAERAARLRAHPEYRLHSAAAPQLPVSTEQSAGDHLAALTTLLAAARAECLGDQAVLCRLTCRIIHAKNELGWQQQKIREHIEQRDVPEAERAPPPTYLTSLRERITRIETDLGAERTNNDAHVTRMTAHLDDCTRFLTMIAGRIRARTIMAECDAIGVDTMDPVAEADAEIAAMMDRLSERIDAILDIVRDAECSENIALDAIPSGDIERDLATIRTAIADIAIPDLPPLMARNAK